MAMAPCWARETGLPSVETTVVLEMRRSMVELEDADLRSPGLTG